MRVTSHPRHVQCDWRLACPLAGLVLLGFVGSSAIRAGEPLLQIEMDQQRPQVVFLSWDTEDGARAATNLLRPGQAMRLRIRSTGQGNSGDGLPVDLISATNRGTTYYLIPAPAAELLWRLSPRADSLSMTLSRRGTSSEPSAGVELLVPFDPRVTPTTVLPGQWEEDGNLRLPAVINAPDFGQMLLSESGGDPLKARLEGSRAEKVVDLVVELPPLKSGESCTLNCTIMPRPWLTA